MPCVKLAGVATVQDFCCGATPMNTNFADFCNKSPQGPRHYVYQLIRKDCIERLNYYTVVRPSMNLILTCFLCFALFVSLLGEIE